MSEEVISSGIFQTPSAVPLLGRDSPDDDDVSLQSPVPTLVLWRQLRACWRRTEETP